MSLPPQLPNKDTDCENPETTEGLNTHEKVISSTPTIVSRRPEKDNLSQVTFQRMFHCLKPQTLADLVMEMSERNYGVKFDVSVTQNCTLRVCAALETGSGSNFFCHSDLPSTDVNIS